MMPRTPTRPGIVGRIRKIDGKVCIEYRAHNPRSHFEWAHELREGHSITTGFAPVPMHSVIEVLERLDKLPELVFSNPMDPVQCADERRHWLESLGK